MSAEDAKIHGGVFSYTLGKGRITVFADPKLFKMIFHSQTDYPDISVNEGVAAIAEKWFQIPKEFHDSTRAGLDAVRKVGCEVHVARVCSLASVSPRLVCHPG